MSNVEFLIHEVEQDGQVMHVSGIVNKGNVSLDTEFVSVRSASGEENTVSLRVSNIVAYRRQIGDLPSGMSGELWISGEGETKLAKHFMLSTN